MGSEFNTKSASRSAATDHDVVIIGAGFTGLYAVHRLRDKLNMRVQAFESGSGVGGTWFWNRYPGARCDFESIHYSFSFSKELQQEWKWSERFASQPEILEYLQHVATRFDLERSFQFNTQVTAMRWNDVNNYWTVETDDGKTCTARFVISGVGNLSVPKEQDFPGAEVFKGDIYNTGRWPHTPVDFTGKRVGIIGTGASGIQAIPMIAKRAKHLTVFQRTPNFAAPLRNVPMTDEEMDDVRSRYDELRDASRNNFIGAPYEPPQESAMALSAEERRAVYDRYYDGGGFRMLASTFQDLLIDRAANDTVADYLRERIAERVQDPAVAELLSPRDHAYGTKRPPFESNYYEAFNRDNVKLVDVKKNPIQCITEKGVCTEDAEYEFDVIVLATGFDAFTGPLLNLGIEGRDGLKLSERWSDGPKTYLGLAAHGFPNLFMLMGPQSAAAIYNNPLAIEDHVEFASDLIEHMQKNAFTTFEVSANAEAEWGAHIQEVASHTLFPTTQSAYNGANIPGKPRVLMIYVGGAPAYRKICADVVEANYRGFDITGKRRG
ncbi:flavin-containing monooxygenase [Paraburkholderia sp. ZP32-5]|uniref:flavin-containing monooxygenase n=1 Tax=Paraburkholderia sp. ZP32-5 TaxID=2883245 RepID=UPI001F213ADA|nr:NAD(P)/FAD-dependent oxidoreductase [Paraburkholderia sp. ZP32-5]